ncbi:restriction endonuclease subunit S, partial [Chryseobacterium ginsenosidimutans]|uniref:restriction endonuclease subunit S n=1 Tax=Chryseobacterium ginsenosidimutans TaxID=687846 RepID=UPI0031D267B2
FPNSRNIPKLRFLKFNDEWKNKKLGDLMNFKVTNSYSRDNLNYESGTVKNVHYGDIHTKFQTLFDLGKENVPYINEDILLNRISEDFYCQEGDIIFADASEDLNDVGKSIEITNLNGEKLLSGLHTLLARPQKNNFSKGFLGYLLKSDFVRNQIKREAQGSKVLSINVGRISNIHLSFPSLSEQQKISEFLSILDKRILCSMKIIEGLITQKNFIIKKLFKQNLSDLNTILLSDFLKIPNKVKPNIIDKEKLLTVKLHLKGVHKNENSDSLSLGATNYFIRKKGQFIYGKQNLFNGAFAIIPDKYDGFLSSADVPALDINENIVNAKYLFYFFSRESFYKKLEDIASGSGSKRIHENTLLNLKITIPSLAIQNKVARFLSKFDEKINIENELLTQYENQKKYLLQNLFV